MPPVYYGEGTYYFPTNPVAGAGNYAFRITAPVITNDPIPLLYSRAGALRTDANYTGRFLAGVDLLNWNNCWSNQIVGIEFYANLSDPLNSSTYIMGWGPRAATLGIGMFQMFGGELVYALVAEATEGGAVLNTNHQYQMVASSHNGTNFLAQIFDNAQTNNPLQSAITTDSSFAGVGGSCGLLVCARWH
jgi:hypothetical protein